LFATPLLAAWYAFERLDQARLAYRQTIESLAMSPELAGLVPSGHAERVASLVGYIGNRLGLSESDLDDLEMAALLHHLGQVTLDDPDVAGRPDPAHVSAVTGAMLGEIRPLARAGDIVAGDANDERRRIAVQVLRIASEYDDLTDADGTDPAVALETLRTAPGYVYDERVLNALERAVGANARSTD
jgi:HD-GYP domain-containing protein (c-di-GMP phosphodiesterase class II)